MMNIIKCNNNTQDMINALLDREEASKATNKLYKNGEQPKEIVPMDIEEPTEVAGYKVAYVVYEYVNSKKLRIKTTIYDRVSSDNKDNTSTSLSLRFAQ